jgi:NAD(P)-dependent dehydrogenase (short-subunit alcohol dehydrogenase family)
MMKRMSTRAAGPEYAEDGIRINAVAPDKLMCLKKEQDENRTS